MAISADHERLLRSYAAGDVSWTSLRRQGIDNYRDVLAGLGELGLRPPDAPWKGPMSRLDVEAALFCVKLSKTCNLNESTARPARDHSSSRAQRSDPTSSWVEGLGCFGATRLAMTSGEAQA